MLAHEVATDVQTILRDSLVHDAVTFSAKIEASLGANDMAMTDVANVLRASHDVKLNWSEGRPVYVASTERMAVACEVDGRHVILQEAWRTEA